MLKTVGNASWIPEYTMRGFFVCGSYRGNFACNTCWPNTEEMWLALYRLVFICCVSLTCLCNTLMFVHVDAVFDSVPLLSSPRPRHHTLPQTKMSHALDFWYARFPKKWCSSNSFTLYILTCLGDTVTVLMSNKRASVILKVFLINVGSCEYTYHLNRKTTGIHHGLSTSHPTVSSNIFLLWRDT